MEQKHPLPPFTLETAKQKIQLAENAWNSQNPDKIAMAYSVDSEWRNRSQFINGTPEGNWYRAYGNENWEFDENGLMKKRYASINDLPIKEADRKL